MKMRVRNIVRVLLAGVFGFWVVLCAGLPAQAQVEKALKEDDTSGICPQPRKTPNAPEEFLSLKNPLEATPENILAGKTLFHIDAKPHPCRICHGISGDGLGIMFKQLQPKPRNFTCYQVMDELPDGQLFWVIRNGSPGTPMPAFSTLEDDQIWQLILYIRSFSRKK